MKHLWVLLCSWGGTHGGHGGRIGVRCAVCGARCAVARARAQGCAVVAPWGHASGRRTEISRKSGAQLWLEVRSRCSSERKERKAGRVLLSAECWWLNWTIVVVAALWAVPHIRCVWRLSPVEPSRFGNREPVICVCVLKKQKVLTHTHTSCTCTCTCLPWGYPWFCL